MVEVVLVRLLTTARHVMDSVTVFDDKGQLFRIVIPNVNDTTSPRATVLLHLNPTKLEACFSEDA
ncbi:hypothetical protein T12_7114 [Trichinella patagoniensis]|nr:hypothetical protein T06_14557 [Trichinella sp. T6]KRY13563.1 hypothetical protein T12_7114 [Trichinella patagoniensis]